MAAASFSVSHAERQRQAYLCGDAARDQHRIRPAAHMLYEHLVRFAGERAWCWPGEERLATQMQCSVSTIKRMLRELVQAGLIARARRLNRSSLTYISAYTSGTECEPDVDVSMNRSVDADDAVAVDVGEPGGDTNDITVGNSSPPGEEAFFWTNRGPSVGPDANQVIHMKNQNTEGLVDGGLVSPDPQTMLDTPIVSALRNAGIIDPNVLGELAQRSLAQIEQAIHSVNRVRTPDDPRRPGLLVHILRNAGHPFSATGEAKTPEPEHSHRARASRCEEHPSADVHPVADAGTEFAKIWKAALACIAREIPPADFRTWLEPTALIHLEDDMAVIATPNVFVREEVETHYRARLLDIVRNLVGRPVAMEVVIG